MNHEEQLNVLIAKVDQLDADLPVKKKAKKKLREWYEDIKKQPEDTHEIRELPSDIHTTDTGEIIFISVLEATNVEPRVDGTKDVDPDNSLYRKFVKSLRNPTAAEISQLMENAYVTQLADDPDKSHTEWKVALDALCDAYPELAATFRYFARYTIAIGRILERNDTVPLGNTFTQGMNIKQGQRSVTKDRARQKAKNIKRARDLKKAGKKIQDIADELEVSQRQVYNYLKTE